MTSLSERGTAKGQKNMEGVNMPASPKLAWRWIVGTTAAAILLMAALPSVGHAAELTICINSAGRIKGINVPCGSLTSLTWETVGPQGPTGPQGVDGPPGFAGAGGAAGGPGIQGPNGAQGPAGPTGDPGVAGAIGDAGAQGIQGNPGIQGFVGPPGKMGPSGVPGGTETNKTFLTGGTLGDSGFVEGIALSGANLGPSSALELGPGNAAAGSSNFSAFVPMNDPGTAYNLFVNVDHNPGTTSGGLPISYFFVLCKNAACDVVSCVITDPDPPCRDTSFVAPSTGDFITYAQGDTIGLAASASDATANSADVKWSVTYDHTSFTAP